MALLEPGERGNASGYGQFVLAVVGLLIIVGGWVVKTFAPVEAPELDRLTDALALAMRNQWEDAANDRRLLQPAPLPVRWCRTAERVAGPVAAASSAYDDHVPFEPLPGLDRVTPSRLRSGNRRALHTVYGGLASGRLLILGGPGTGKSSAAVLLLLDALRYRDQASIEDGRRIPVPVVFTLQNWNPATTSVQDWLCSKLSEIPLFAGRTGTAHAKALLRAGRIAVFLDGLDEIPEQTRPLALQALSEQATFRLVVLSRVTALAGAALDHTLTGAAAIELQLLTPTDVADYLVRPLAEPAPPAWQAVAATLTQQPDSVLTRTLTTPLAACLLRDAYLPAAPVDELLDETRFPDSDGITNHLLDRAITTAYGPRPGQPTPRYTAETAHRTLTVIATYMNHHHTRDLRWWTIPTWIPRARRTFMTVLFATLAFGLPVGLSAGITDGITEALWSGTEAGLWTGVTTGASAGLIFGLVFGLPAGLVAGLRGSAVTPPRAKRFGWRQLFTIRHLTRSLPRAFVFGLMFGVGFESMKSDWSSFQGNATAGIVFGFIAGLVAGLRGSAVTRPRMKRFGWRLFALRHLMFALPIGLMFAIVFYYGSLSLFGYRALGPMVVSVVVPVAGLMIGLVAALVWPQFFAVRQLAAGLPFGVAVGLFTGLVRGLQEASSGLAGVLIYSLVTGVVVGLASALTFGLVTELFTNVNNTDSVDPVKAWEGDNAFGLMIGLAGGLTAGLASWAILWGSDLTSAPYGLGVGVAAGLTTWLTYSRAGTTAVAQIHLATRHNTPLRLMRFLDDARSRHLLRAVGPIYQFRHATLQDRLEVSSAPRQPQIDTGAGDS
ncbi:hypothetical protein ABZ345_47030 [Lentzea sp. NPDC005914]|uniref:hypothetical protein n=1 Tax=Lentzea sp. NPDC005914 TaxID=3154572 RepID=UPI0033E426FB